MSLDSQAARQLFRGGPPALRADWRVGVPAVRRALLLVPEIHRQACCRSGWASWNFWLFFIGFNMTFFPMHSLGLRGMTRRIYTYDAESGWGGLEPPVIDRGAVDCGQRAAVHRKRDSCASQRSARRVATLEWNDAGVGHVVAAALLWLRQCAGRGESSAAAAWTASHQLVSTDCR